MSYNFNTQISFENGLTISFAIGEGNYCENKSYTENPFNIKKERQSKNCEVLIFKSENNQNMPIEDFISIDQSNDGTVAGWVTPNELAFIINKVANWKERL